MPSSVTTREDQALPADQSPRPPLSTPEQPKGEQPADGRPAGERPKDERPADEQPAPKLPGLPRLHFPEQPGGQGPAPAPGGYPPPATAPWDAPPQPPGNGPGPPQGTPPDSAPRWGNGPGADGRPAPGRPAGPPRPTRPPEPSVRQRALAAFFLGGLSVLAALLGVGSNPHRGIYLVLFALVVGVAACWLAISAMQQARRAGSMRPRGAVFATVLGVLGSLLSVIMLVAFAVFWQQLTTFNQCISSANTLTAQQQCLTQVHRALNGEISKLGARG